MADSRALRLFPDLRNTGTAPESTGNRSRTISRTVMESPCSRSETAAKQPLAEEGKQHALQRQDERRGEQPADQQPQADGRRAGAEVGRIEGRGKNQGREEIRVEQEAGDEDGDGGNARQEEPAIWNGQRSVRTKTSSRSGKNRSHSKTVMMPMATKE
jgi:hypothetical protein